MRQLGNNLAEPRLQAGRTVLTALSREQLCLGSEGMARGCQREGGESLSQWRH